MATPIFISIPLLLGLFGTGCQPNPPETQAVTPLSPNAVESKTASDETILWLAQDGSVVLENLQIPISKIASSLNELGIDKEKAIVISAHPEISHVLVVNVMNQLGIGAYANIEIKVTRVQQD